MLRMGVRSNSASASHKLVWANGSPSTVAFNQGGVHGSAYLNSARDTRTPSANRQRSPSPAHGEYWFEEHHVALSLVIKERLCGHGSNR
jgi:hypothetical protein